MQKNCQNVYGLIFFFQFNLAFVDSFLVFACTFSDCLETKGVLVKV